jgi:hypothetical protein
MFYNIYFSLFNKNSTPTPEEYREQELAAIQEKEKEEKGFIIFPLAYIHIRNIRKREQ